MDTYTKVIQLIQAMSTQTVKQAEVELDRLVQQNKDILNHLIAIFKDYNLPQYVKTIAASYLNSAICDNTFKTSLEQYALVIENILLDKAIQPRNKRILERSIVHIIDSLQQQITELREFVFRLMKEPELRDAAYLLIGCFCIPESVDVQHIIYLAHHFMPQTLGMIVLTQNQESLLMVKQYNEIIKTWIVAWDRLVKEQGIDGGKQSKNPQVSNLLQQIVQQQYFNSILLSIAQWKAQQSILFCIDKDLYQLNMFKLQASQLHERALRLAYKKSIELKIYRTTATIIPKIINSLIIVPMSNDFLENYECKDYATSLLKILKLYFACKPQVFKNDWKLLLSSIIFPLMKPFPEELALFDQSPIQYITLFEDSAEKQKFGILKTQACKFLEKISDSSEILTQSVFVTDFIINFAVDSVKNYWKVPVENSYGIQFVDLDVGILILAIFSYRLEHHQKKISEFTPLLNKQLVLKMNSYQRSRLYMFLSYNYGLIYKNLNEGAFWVELAFNQHQQKATKFCADDFLFNIADQYYSDYFLQNLTNRIADNDQGNIWDAIEKLINTHAAKVSEALMMETLTKIYSRLQVELGSISQEKISQTIAIVKLIQIIRAIADQDNYCNQNPGVRNMLWKVVAIFDAASKLGFVDQVIYVVQSLVRQQQAISENSQQILPKILAQFVQDEFGDDTYYKILNYYIMKGQSNLMPSILKTIQNGIMYHMMEMGEKIKKSQRKRIHSYLLILVQNILGMHGKSLTKDQLIQISSFMIRYIPDNDNNIDCKVVLARALNTLLLCHMYERTDCVWNYIQTFTYKQIYHNYDLRVLMACINMEIFREEDVKVSAQMITIAANAISLFRKREKLDLNARKVQKKYKKEQKLKFIKHKQYEKILKYMKTPFMSDTKFQTQLTNLLTQLKQANLEAYKNMIQYISKTDTETICEMCKFSEGNLLQKRVIYNVLKTKAPEQIQDEDDKNDMGNSDEEDDEEFKRKRVQQKKKKKVKKTKIDIQ